MRKKRVYKKYYQPDPVYSRIDLSRFINYVMSEGKKTIARKAVYDALEKIKKDTKKEPMEIFEQALENASPMIEVFSKRVGGANYQVPREVRPQRRFMLGVRWIVNAAQAKKGKPIAEKLANELMAAAKNEGDAVKKKQDMHRQAEANRAFAHFVR
jgi:small subunit ribosomal protein S7